MYPHFPVYALDFVVSINTPYFSSVFWIWTKGLNSWLYKHFYPQLVVSLDNSETIFKIKVISIWLFIYCNFVFIKCLNFLDYELTYTNLVYLKFFEFLKEKYNFDKFVSQLHGRSHVAPFVWNIGEICCFIFWVSHTYPPPKKKNLSWEIFRSWPDMFEIWIDQNAHGFFLKISFCESS